MARAREPWNIHPARKSPSVAQLAEGRGSGQSERSDRQRVETQVRQTAEQRRAIQLYHRHCGEMVSEQLLLHCDLRLSKSERLVAIV